jgi:hypothetical protein
MVLFFIVLPGNVAFADPCARVNVQPDAWAKVQIDALVLAARAAFERDEAFPAYQRVLGGIANTLRNCKLSQGDAFASRHREFFDYVTTASLDQQPGHKLGFIVSDKQYFAETRPYVQLPDFLLTQRFLRSVSRDETLDQAKSFLRLLNSRRGPDDQLIVFSYRSRHLGTPDNNNSFKRLLIVVPGNAENGVPEKWIQFGITDPGASVLIRNVSVVSVLPRRNGLYDVYFKDFYRTYRRDGSIRVNGRWELGYGTDNCVNCHKSGILPIFPEAGSVSPNEQQAVQAVNQRFVTYGSPSFEPYLDISKFGLGVGSPRLGSHNRQGFSEGPGGTVVSHAMNCATCHNAQRLGALNWPMDSALINSYITGGRMPLGYQLRTAERDELYQLLIQEYFAIEDTNPGILKSWLLGRQQ